MINQISVSPWNESDAGRYYILLCAVGYEERSRFIADRLHSSSTHKIAVGFDYHCTQETNINAAWFNDNLFFYHNNNVRFSTSDIDFSEHISRLLGSCISESESPVRIAIDISSFSSVRLASIVEYLFVSSFEKEIEVDFLYAPGVYHGALNNEDQIECAGPVNPRLAGWSSEPESPVVAIFGLGLEYDRSIGAYEYLNPGLTYTFATLGANSELERKSIDESGPPDELGRLILEANKQLFPLVPPAQRFTYDVAKPKDCYNMVRSVSFGAMRFGRTVFVPLGPKIFTLCSLLVANEAYPQIAVWRISTGQHGEPRNIIARGDIVGLRVVFRTIN